MEITLDPGHPVNIMTIQNLAVLYDDMGDEANAWKFYDQAAKLSLEHRGPNDPDTHVVLRNIAIYMHRSGNVEKQLECLNIVARGSEAIYGLANLQTIQDLQILYSWYERQGLSSEADAKAVNEKIIKAERILADYNRMKIEQ